MTQRQINTLTMFQAVLQFLKDKLTVWSGILAVAEQQAIFKASVDDINAKSLEQFEGDTEGYTTSKYVAIDVMTVLAYTMALRIKAYAKKIGDAVLFESVNYSETALHAGPEEDVINRCQVIVNAGRANLAALTPKYMVTADDVTALQNAIAEEAPKTAERDTIGGERTAITQSFPTLFKKASGELDDLDDLVEGLIADVDFVSAYFVVRRTNDRRGGNSGNAVAGKVG